MSVREFASERLPNARDLNALFSRRVAYPEHGGLLRVSDRAFEMFDRVGNRFIALHPMSTLDRVKGRVQNVLDR
jgi:hypothetical protein